MRPTHLGKDALRRAFFLGSSDELVIVAPPIHKTLELVVQENCHLLAGRVGVRKGEFFLADGDKFKTLGKVKAIRLREYLDTLTEARKQHALEDCSRELLDLGLDPADFGAAEAANAANNGRPGANLLNMMGW